MKKKLRIGKETGSLVNHIESGSNALPVVGLGATELLWSDRHAYEVLRVQDNYKYVTIQRYKPKRIDGKDYYSEVQKYEYKELTGPIIKLVFRNGAYRYPKEEIKSWTKQGEQNIKEFFEKNPNASKYNPIEGDCVYTTKWNKMNVVFQRKEEYFDPSF